MRSLLFFDHVHSATHSLRANRLRSTLTTLGIAIGIASVTTILALAEGVTNSVARQVDDVGGNVAVIRPGGELEASTTSIANPLSPQRFSTSTLTEADLDHIRSTNTALTVAPIMTLNATLRAGDDTVSNATIVATTPSLADTTKLPIEEGQFIDDVSSQQTATIGQQLAIDLFGEENPIGNTFHLRGTTFTIIGTLQRLNKPVNYSGVDFDRAVIIHLAAGKAVHDNRTQIQQINIAAPTPEILASSLDAIDEKLRQEHGEADFTILSAEDLARPTSQLFQLLTNVMTAIAAVSLVVGGIGIMNIMLVSVAERTREIGIRKSVGASNRNILSQFLIESLMMSLMGGALGVLLGIVAAFIIGTTLFFSPVITWPIVGVSMGLSVLVGVLFGMYPAIRAARKDPIESLRQYR